MNINLWDPTNLDLISAFVISYLLGVVHGITPDEHTWPITFSYSVGSYSTRGGFKAGAIFSAGFTLQRAILSEIAYFALAGIFMTAWAFGITYVMVGIAMAAAGIYISRKGKYAHFHIIENYLGKIFHLHVHEDDQNEREMEHKANPVIHDLKPIPLRLAFVHGVIAGFGFGAFALIIYTVLAPAMPSPLFGFVPGLLFGLGTMTMQVVFGMGFGKWMQSKRNLTKEGIAYVARSVSRYVLTYGGYAFIIAGIAILAFPGLLNYGINTGIKVHNLHTLGFGFFLVIFSVAIIGLVGYRKSLKTAQRDYKQSFSNTQREKNKMNSIQQNGKP